MATPGEIFIRKHPLSLAVAMSLSAMAAQGEEAQPEVNTERDAKPEVIVVTATKEGGVPLQEVPASITAFGATQLAEGGIKNIEDIKMSTPGLNVTRNGQATRLYMRGIGTNLDFIGSDPSVTVHQDGVYQSRSTTVLTEFLGVERVEVLRGPQGTIYGRNSTGGTINVISALPEADPEAKVGIELGNFSQRTVLASAGGALGSDSAMGNLALMMTAHDPYVDLEGNSAEEGLLDDDSLGAKGALRFLIGAQGELILRGDYASTDRSSGAYKPTGLTTTGAPAPLAGLVNLPPDPWTMNISYQDPFMKQDDWGTSAELKWALNDRLSLTSLTGYRDLDFHTIEDTDGSNLAVLYTDLHDLQDQLSEELRLNYRGEGWKGVVGLYYLTEDQTTRTAVNVEGPGLKNQFIASNDTTAYAAFGQGTYAVTDKLNTTLGIRYSYEEKHFLNNNQLLSVASGAKVSGFDVDDTTDWDSWSPKVGFDYHFAPDKMLYVSASQGFKSGGYNLTGVDARFDPETVWAYELGFKLQLAEDELRTNIALFYYDYTDLQVSDFTRPGVLSITNAADAVIQGIEIENQWTPNANWRFEFNYAFLDAEYDTYVAPDGARLIDVSGNRLNAAPRNKLSLAAQYYQQVSYGTFSYRLEWFWQDSQFFTAFNRPTSAQGAYGLTNARISYYSADNQWEVQAYGENLGDKAYSTSSREFPAATVGVTKDINPPRTVGVRLVYHWM